MDRPTPRAGDFAPPRRKPRQWKPDPRAERALDAHIRSRYGDEYTWGRWCRE